MKLADIHAAVPAKKSAKVRLGRGHGSGKGKTSGKGQKGQNSRSGAVRNAAFGGEARDGAWWRKIPKLRGTGNTLPRRTEFEIVKLSTLEAAGLKKIDPITLFEAGIITGARPVKILFDEAVKSKFEFDGVAMSARVREFAAAPAKKSAADAEG